MTLCKHLPLLLIFSFVVVPASQAQTDEIEIALPYQLIAGRLSVTFADSVSEAHALNSLETLGYEVVQQDFPPVSMVGLMDGMLTDQELDALRSHPLVEDVKQIDILAMRKKGLENLKKADPEIHKQVAPLYAETEKTEQARLLFTLVPTLTADQASALVTSLLPSIVVERTEKRPNEAIIAVKEGTEEDAIKQIDALPEVRYVAYINAN